MRFALTVSTLLLTALPAFAGPYAPHEYDFNDLQGLEISAFGVVESVREFSARQEVIVRLEDGRQIVVVQNGTPPVEPGERVRLARNGLGFSILNL